ncbi:MAG TPA: NAD(P)H-hydrate dehydratase, partial [Dehalococcoidia bacterium]|nr:NAD(P)H-hydrate dehydratase [Dehalococcoidia bacterium]
PRHGHKGTFGRVLVVAGSTSYYGAAALACEAAYRAGAGLVTLATPGSLVPIFATKLTEPTFWPLPEEEPGSLSPGAVAEIDRALAASDAALIGPGLGLRPGVAAALERLLPVLDRWGQPVVLDADALNALAGTESWWDRLGPTAVLTPHPGEFARMTRRSTAEIAAQRESLARVAARDWRQTVLLKGAHTVIAAPNGECFVSPWANPLLASGGTGDVLAGLIAGLLAQGAAGLDAAATAVWLHAAAADRLSQDYGDAGLLARELLPLIPRLRRELIASLAWPA